MAVVPGGCTKFVQPADVSWNKPFKDQFREFYDDWMESGEKTYTKGGNMRAPTFELVCKWIVDSWDAVSNETIKKSFRACGIGISICGGQDGEISVFKDGRGCEAGLGMLKAAAAAQRDQEYEEEHILVDSEEEDDDVVEEDDD